jgi:hypothetical protein
MSPARAAARSVLLAVHALPPFELSGAPLAAFGYARALGEAGWRVTVLSAHPGAHPWTTLRPTRHPSEPFSRITVPHFLGTGTSWLDAWSVPTVVSAGGHDGVDLLLRRLAPDVLHVADNVFLPLSLPERASRMGIPVVRSVACAEDLCALVAPVLPCSGLAGYCAGPITAAHCASCVGRSVSDDSLERFRLIADPAADALRRTRLLGLLGAQQSCRPPSGLELRPADADRSRRVRGHTGHPGPRGTLRGSLPRRRGASWDLMSCAGLQRCRRRRVQPAGQLRGRRASDIARRNRAT